MEALNTKSKGVIQCLLDYGANLDDLNENINLILNDDNETPLHIACEIGNLDLINLLLLKNPDLTLKRKDGKLPFNIALENGHMTLANLLLNQYLRHGENNISEILLDTIKTNRHH